MKKSLRLFTLLSLLFATIGMANAVSAYKIEVNTIPKWTKTTNVTDRDARQVALFGGTIYVNDIANDKVWYYNQQNSGQFSTAAIGNKGTAIACDDAGNLVLIDGANKTWSFLPPTKLFIYGSDGTYKATIELPEDVKTVISAACSKCRYISACGDLSSEKGGFVLLYAKDAVKIAIKSNAYYQYKNFTIGLKSTSTETYMNAYSEDNWLMQDRSTGLYNFNATTNTYKEINAGTNKRYNTNGCDKIALRGHNLLIINDGSTPYDGEFSIYDESENNKLISNIKSTTTKSSTNSNWLFTNPVSENECEIYQYNNIDGIIRCYSIKAVSLYVAPTAFTLTSKVSTKAGEKNIFLGFDATWTAPVALDGYTISYKLTHSAGSVDIPAGTTTTTLYGANAGDISLQAVYTSNSDLNLIYYSEIVKAPYTPINVLEPANITEIKDKKRYDIDGVYTATLNWAVTTTNPIAHYLVKYADATKAGAITYKEFYGAERNYPFTGLQNMTVGQDKTTSQADGSMSKLAENPTGVIVNYLIVPGYRIGNTIKQKIVDADYSDATIATVNYPTALTGMMSTTFTKDMPTLTGVEGIEVGKVAIYPNPTTGQVTIALNSEISTVAVYSLSGALVRNIDGNGEVTMPCDFSDLASGVYFVKVNNCNPTKVIIK